MSRYKFSWVLLILLLTGFVVLLPSLSILATADTIELYPAADTFIVSNQPDTNFGSNTGLMVGELSNTGLLHTRIRFIGIPAGTSIQSATLRLYRTMGSGSHTLAVQSASRSWQESILTWNADGSTNRWTTPKSTYGMINQTGYVSVDVTSHVQEWADSYRSNCGFHLSTDGTIGENHTFASRESATSSYWPRLEIVYSLVIAEPDLIVQSVTDVSASYNVGDKISATATIKNNGAGSAGSTDLKYYLGTTSDHDYRYIEQGTVGALLAGDTDTDIINWPYWTIPSDIPSGTYHVWVQADSSNDEPNESDEGNNWGSSASFTIQGLTPTYAVIVGVADYPGTSNDLNFCDDDARDFRIKLLEDTRWQAENVILLIDSQASRANIQAAIQNMVNTTNSNDTCVFFFSGHGTNGNDISPIDENDGLDEYICAFDSNIRDDELAQWLSPLSASTLCVFLDTCYSGGQIKTFVPRINVKTINLSGPLSARNDGFAADLIVKTKDLDDLAFFISTACDDDELSIEGPQWNNGLYTEFLLEAMDMIAADSNVNGQLSGEEAHGYLSPPVTAANPNQNPQSHDGNGNTQSEFVIAGTSGGGDSYEPDNSHAEADAISSGQPQTHSIVPATDQDWVYFTLSGPSDVVIETSGASGDTRMWLFESDGTTQIEYNDDDGAGNFSRIDRLQSDGNELPAGTYYVKIDEYGNNNEIDSYYITLTVTPNQPPPPPTVVDAQTGSGAGQIVLSWNAVMGATGYKIYYDEDSSNPPFSPSDNGNPVSGSAVGNVTQVAISDLTPGGAYYCAVVAYNSVGDSGYSSQDSATAGDNPSGLIITNVNVTHSWQAINLSATCTNPVVIAGPPTYHGADPGVVRLQNVTNNSFDVRFQEWLYKDGSHTQENIPYLVISGGRHQMANGSIWEAGTFSVSGTGAWTVHAFTDTFPSTPALFLTAQTYNGSDPVTVRARNVTNTGFEAALFEEEAKMDGHTTEEVGYLAVYSPHLSGTVNINGTDVPYLLQAQSVDHRFMPVLSSDIKLEEEQSKDSEIGHINETVSILALGNKIFTQDMSSNGGDTIAIRRMAPEYNTAMEWGTVDGADQNWMKIPLAKEYLNPVVVAKPVSSRGGDPGVIRIRNVSHNSFELRYNEWAYKDGWHTQERVFYMVAETGIRSVAGLTVEARELNTSKLLLDGWELITFSASFSQTPSIFTSVQTCNGADPVTTRLSNCTATGFDLTMDEEEAKNDGHTTETIGWIAIKRGTGNTADNRSVVVLSGSTNHIPTQINFGQSMARRFPVVVSDMITTYGSDPGFLRYQNLLPSSIDLFIQEEASLDAEMNHTTEDVSLFVAE